MNKVVVTTISSIMAILILTVMIANPILATLGNDDEMTGDESIDECAQKFNPDYDLERFLRCSGGIGDPMR